MAPRRLLTPLVVVLAVVAGLLVVISPPVTPPAQAFDNQDPTECLGAVALTNGGFEQPVVPARSFRLFNETAVPGWETTATDNQIELWSSGFNGVPAHSGSQFAELNATQNAALFQTVPTVPGQSLTWSLAHRARTGTDTMVVEFGAPGGPYTIVRTISSDTTAWTTHTGTYQVPAGQTRTDLRFRAVSTGSGSPSVGNFLDSIVFGTDACLIATKSVVNESRPADGIAQVGDTLAYSVNVVNDGGATATGLVITDAIPAGTAYVPGSLSVVSSPAAAQRGTRTDAADGDGSQLDSGGGGVTFRVGSGATATVGGSLLPGEAVAVRFRVRITADAADGEVVNAARATYGGGSLGTALSNEVTTAVAPAANLIATKGAEPATVVAGESLTYTIGARNDGPNPADGVQLSDPAPPGTTITTVTPPAGTSCTTVERTVTCTVGTLAVGAVVEVPIAVDVAPGVTAALVNTVTVTTDTSEVDSTDNTATVRTPVRTSADVSVSKTVDLTTVVAGETLTYTLTVGNAGPSSAADVVVADTLPAGTTLVSATPSVGSCTTTTTSLECALGVVAPDASPTVTVVADVGADVTATDLINTATVRTTTPDPVADDNADAVTTPVTRSADLSLVKTGPATATAGRQVTHTVEVTNAGPSSALDVVVEDPAPDGLTLVSATSTQGTCDAAGSCTIGAVAVGSTVTITLVHDVADDRTTAITNTATVAGSTSDPDTDDLSDSVTTDIVASADLGLTKTQDPEVITYGEDVTWSLTVTNAGPSTAQGVAVTDPLPAGFAFVASADGCVGDDDEVSCPVGTLAPGDTATLTFVAASPADGEGTVTNTAEVSSDTPDPEPDNDTATVVSNADARADLVIGKTTAPDPTVAGQDVVYTLTVDNLGPSDAADLTVTDTLPDGITFTADGSDPTCTADGQQVTCTADALAVGDQLVLVVAGTIDPGVRGASVNTATVAAVTPDDPTAGNNTAGSEVVITGEADPVVTLTADATEVTAGTVVGFVASAGNNGPSTAEEVVITVQLPEGMTPVPDSVAGGCTVSGLTITCRPGVVDPAETLADLGFQVLVAADVAPGTTLTPTVEIRSITPDTDQTNNVDEAPVTVTAEADLEITKTVTPTTVVAGTPISYVVSVTNLGASLATGIAVTDDLPAALVVTTATSGATDCPILDGRLTCALPDLAPGATAEIVVTGVVDPAATAELSNVAAVTADTPDPEPDNGSVTLVNPIEQSADLRVVKTAPATVTAGLRVSYQLVVTNAGPSVAGDVVLSDPLPTGLAVDDTVITTADPTTCTLTDRTVECTLGTLADGETRTVTVDARVTAGTADGSELVNTATVTSATDGPAAGRTADPVTTTVDTAADVTLTKRAVGSPSAGNLHGYRIVLTNDGPSTARGVVVTDPTPEGATFVDAAEPPSVTCGGATDVRCDVGDLAPGAVVVVTVRYLLDPDLFGDNLTNTATAASDTADPTPANNTDTVSQPVADATELSIAKTADAGEVVAGGPVSFTVTAGVVGPSDARGLTITDPAPPRTRLVSATPSGDGSCDIADGAAVCDWSSVAVGEQRTAQLVYTLDDDLDDGTEIVNTATVSSTTPALPVSADDRITVGTSSDLQLTKQVVSGGTVAGTDIAWELQLTHSGVTRARDVVISDQVPAAVSAIRADAPTDVTCTVDDGLVECRVDGGLAGETTRTVTVTGRVDPGFRGELRNEAQVTGSVPDSLPADDLADAVATIGGVSDITVTKAAERPRVEVGESVDYRIVVDAGGPSQATGIVVDEQLPAGARVVAAEPSQGAYDVATQRWTVGELAPGGRAELVLTVVHDREGAPAVNRVVAESAEDTSEVDAAEARVEVIADDGPGGGPTEPGPPTEPTPAPTEPEPSQPEPSQPEPSQPEPSQPEPSQPEPSESESGPAATVEPGRPDGGTGGDGDRLPDTGAPGTGLLLIMGLVALAAAGVLLGSCRLSRASGRTREPSS